jgi:BMFP domain-containing protein YqiC
MTEEQKPTNDILDELEALGQQLTTALKTLWESEESQKLRQDLRQGFVQLGQEIDEAVKTAQDSEAAKQFSEQVKGTMDKARQSDIASKVEEGLASGLRKMNAELSKIIDSLEDEADETPSQTETPS